MQSIEIKNFGPLKDIRLDIKDVMIFIGPQASGKSTISKTIYFFRSLRDDLTRYVMEAMEDENFNKLLGTFAKRIRAKFLDFWGPTYHLDNLYLKYNYSETLSISITLKGKYVNPDFSSGFKKGFSEIFQQAELFSTKIKSQKTSFLSSGELLSIETEKRSFLSRIHHLVCQFFSDSRDYFFVPAGRSLLATLSDQLQNIHPHKTDYLMRAFIERINNSKTVFFNLGIDDLIMQKKKLTQAPIDFQAVSLAKSLLKNILRGEYRYDQDGEKLYFEATKYTKINHASSGQQEAMWILLLILSLIILDNRDVFIVFEEPEAHLYPEAQKEMVDLIGLLSNLNANQTIITTHSPYILSSFNNLLYAHNLGVIHHKSIKPIVDEKLWINRDRISAYFVDDGVIKNIIESDSGLIKLEAIDSASIKINEIYNKLFDLDM